MNKTRTRPNKNPGEQVAAFTSRLEERLIAACYYRSCVDPRTRIYHLADRASGQSKGDKEEAALVATLKAIEDIKLNLIALGKLGSPILVSRYRQKVAEAVDPLARDLRKRLDEFPDRRIPKKRGKRQILNGWGDIALLLYAALEHAIGDRPFLDEIGMLIVPNGPVDKRLRVLLHGVGFNFDDLNFPMVSHSEGARWEQGPKRVLKRQAVAYVLGIEPTQKQIDSMTKEQKNQFRLAVESQDHSEFEKVVRRGRKTDEDIWRSVVDLRLQSKVESNNGKTNRISKNRGKKKGYAKS